MESAPPPVQFLLFADDLRRLQAGQAVWFAFGMRLFEIVPRADITGTSWLVFSQRRTVTLTWPAAHRERCIRTVRWYLDSGAAFVDEQTRRTLDNPNEIIQRRTTCLCQWHYTKPENRGKPSPHKLWAD